MGNFEVGDCWLKDKLFKQEEASKDTSSGNKCTTYFKSGNSIGFNSIITPQFNWYKRHIEEIFCLPLGGKIVGISCTDSTECGTGGFCNFDSTTVGTCEYCKDIIICEDETFVTQKGKDECKSVCESSTTKTSSTKPTEASTTKTPDAQPTKLEGFFFLSHFIFMIRFLKTSKLKWK